MKLGGAELKKIQKAKAEGKYFYINQKSSTKALVAISEVAALRIVKTSIKKGDLKQLVILYPGEGVMGKAKDVLEYASGKKESPKKDIVVSTTAHVEPKRGEVWTASKLQKLLASDIKNIMLELGLEDKGTKAKNALAILKFQRDGASPKKKLSPKKLSPKKISPKKNLSPPKGKKQRDAALMCATVDGEYYCKEGEFCSVEKGTCNKKTTSSGDPWGSGTLKKKLGDEYLFDRNTGLYGGRTKVLEHLRRFGIEGGEGKSPKKLSPSKSPKKTPPKKPKAKKCYDEEDPLLCPEDKVCNSQSGRCINKSKKQQARLITNDGRVLTGPIKTLETFQAKLGGEIVGVETAVMAEELEAELEAGTPLEINRPKKIRKPSTETSPAEILASIIPEPTVAVQQVSEVMEEEEEKERQRLIKEEEKLRKEKENLEKEKKRSEKAKIRAEEEAKKTQAAEGKGKEKTHPKKLSPKKLSPSKKQQETRKLIERAAEEERKVEGGRRKPSSSALPTAVPSGILQEQQQKIIEHFQKCVAEQKS
jgi:colicin import membrane protein